MAGQARQEDGPRARRISVPFGFEAFREVARRLLVADLPPSAVALVEAPAFGGVLASEDDGLPAPRRRGAPPPITVPLSFVRRVARVLCHRDPDRLDLAYRLLWRVTHGERRLLADPAHADVERFLRLEAAVVRDVHEVVVAARFSPHPGPPRALLACFHEPWQRTARLAAPRFVARFRGRPFVLLTPDDAVLWDGAEMSFGPGLPEPPGAGELGPTWQRYYAEHADEWGGLPEPADLSGLRDVAPWPSPAAGDARFVAHPPDTTSLAVLGHDATACEACPRVKGGRAVVFGQGPPGAALMFVGGQPERADVEAGAPFLGPAGQAFERALHAAGLRREIVYLTFAVKHFVARGEAKDLGGVRPEPEHIRACRPWLDAEIRAVRPLVVVALGPVAGWALLGPSARDPTRMGQVLGRRDGRKLVLAYPIADLLKKGRATGQFDRLVHDIKKAAAAARMRE